MFSTHILEEVDAACTRAIIIDRGKIVANGTPKSCATCRSRAGAVGLSAGEREETRQPRTGRALNGAWRIYPHDKSEGAELAQAVVDLVAREGWKVEGMYSERGELDEVFRRITLPDTVKHEVIWTIAKRELGAYFTSPVAYVFLVIFLLLTGFFTFHGGQLLRARRSEPRGVLRLASVALPRARAGGRHAALGGGAALRTLELLLTMPVAPWQAIVAKFLASWLFLALALALTFPAIVTVNILGDPDNGIIAGGLHRQLPRSGAYLAMSHDFRDDAQPGGGVHPRGGDLPVPHPRRVQSGHRSPDALGEPRVRRYGRGFLGGDALRRLPARGDRQPRSLFFLSVIGFALFATGVIIRGHSSG